ncbi:MAG TPA: APC family permease [Streptosporangiaceae bacterium]|nr:APC family permease [Streptosporangiaceae bacterium]HVB45318.1 APC family permease [Streptosporangiaceae bacterium]
MTDQSAVAETVSAPAARLEPDAIGVAQDTVIGMASSAPAASVGLTLAALAAATAYGSGPIIILTAIPMLIIANAYRRLNMWNANCGASFEWVGRAINPYLGFLTGWLMIAAYVIATVSGVEVLGPSVLAIFGSDSTSVWANIGVGTAVGVVMLVIAVVGIRITARAQVGMAVVEYLILIGLAVAGLVAVLGHHHGTFPITKDWLSLSGIGGKGSAAAGFLVAVFIFTGWDGTLYVNEEVKHRRTNPGKAAIVAVAILAVIYTVSIVGLQGVVTPARLQANSASALVYVAQALGGGGWAKAMALALALSVVATTGTGIVLTARIVYGMASYRVLPEFLANVSRRFSTPVAASVIVGVLIIGLTWIYLLTTSVQNAFDDVVAVTGLLFAVFYILTALATIVYYRRRVLTSAWDGLVLGLLPIAAAGFLGWVVVRSLQSAPTPQIWSLVGIVAVGLVLMLAARFILRSPFFQIQRESDTGGR